MDGTRCRGTGDEASVVAVGDGARRALAAPVDRVVRPVVRRVRTVRQAGRVRTRPVAWSDVERLCAMPGEGTDMVPDLERLLVDNLLPFWDSRSARPLAAATARTVTASIMTGRASRGRC